MVTEHYCSYTYQLNSKMLKTHCEIANATKLAKHCLDHESSRYLANILQDSMIIKGDFFPIQYTDEQFVLSYT